MKQKPHPLPYYAVIFTSVRTSGDNGYSKMADRMMELAQKQDGFISVDSAREHIGITVSYWKDLDSIKKWKENIEHKEAQKKGKSLWYKNYNIKIAKIENEYSFETTSNQQPVTSNQ
ncbi:MAG: antibiotic biosynthesis monooxygenase [Bacteroidota bacterium]